jgi:hypothetical protein
MVNYKEELCKLLAIVRQDPSDECFIAKDYIQEKLIRALDGSGIGIHTTLKPVVEKLMEQQPKWFREVMNAK